MKNNDDQMLEEAYAQINEPRAAEYSIYSGDPQYFIWLDDIEKHIGKIRAEVTKGRMSFKTVHGSYQNDAANYGYPFPKSDRHEKQRLIVFYEPQDFTRPALIPV